MRFQFHSSNFQCSQKTSIPSKRSGFNPASRRSMSTNIYDNAIRADAHNNVRKKMLSDPATYPLILILGVAMGGEFLFRDKS